MQITRRFLSLLAQDGIHWTGVFASPEQEIRFRQHQLATDRYLFGTYIILLSVVFLPFVAYDWHLYADTPLAYTLVASRCLFVAIAALAVPFLRKIEHAHTLDAAIISFLLLFCVEDMFILGTRPADASEHCYGRIVIMLCLYAALPLPPVWLLRLLLPQSVVYWLISLYWVTISDSFAVLSISIGFVVGNLFGILVAHRNHVANRRMFAALEQVERLKETAEREAVTDSLTGLYNRRGWNERLSEAERRYQEQGITAGIVALDLDGLKPINDSRGHAAGDTLIVKTGKCLRETLSNVAIIARVGGDEFVALEPDRDAVGTAALVEQLERSLIAAGIEASVASEFWEPGQKRSLTSAWDAADHAMYERKRSRRAKAELRAGAQYPASGKEPTQKQS